MKSSKFLFVTALVLGIEFNFFSPGMTLAMSLLQEDVVTDTSFSNQSEASLHVTAHCPSTIGIEVTKNTMNVLNKSGEQATDPNEYTATFKLSGSAENVNVVFSAESDSASGSGEFRIVHKTKGNIHIPILISFVGSDNEQKIEDVMKNEKITINRKSADTEYKVTAKIKGILPSQIPGSAGDYEGTIKLQVAPAD